GVVAGPVAGVQPQPAVGVAGQPVGVPVTGAVPGSQDRVHDLPPATDVLPGAERALAGSGVDPQRPVAVPGDQVVDLVTGDVTDRGEHVHARPAAADVDPGVVAARTVVRV